MKKLFLITAFIAMAVIATAQTKYYNTGYKWLRFKETNGTITLQIDSLKNGTWKDIPTVMQATGGTGGSYTGTQNFYVQWPIRAIDDSTWGMVKGDATHDGYLDSTDAANFTEAYNKYTVSGTYNSGTGIITLTRKDGTTWTITGITGGSSVGGADDILTVYQALGSAIKAATVGVNYQADGAFTTYTLTDNRCQYVAVYLPTAATITGVGFYQKTQGSYTADNTNQVGLYTYGGGTMTQVAASANNGNLWKAPSNTWVKEAFSSPYSASAGVYFIGFVYNSSAQTTAPVINAGRALNQSNEVTIDFTNSATISGRKTGNSLPGSQTMATLDAATPERPYVFIY